MAFCFHLQKFSNSNCGKLQMVVKSYIFAKCNFVEIKKGEVQTSWLILEFLKRISDPEISKTNSNFSFYKCEIKFLEVLV